MVPLRGGSSSRHLLPREQSHLPQDTQGRTPSSQTLVQQERRQQDREAVRPLSRLPRPCLDCPRIIKSGSRCTSCQRRYERTRRPNTTDRGYDSAWQCLSAQLIKRIGRCKRCGAEPTAGNPLTTDHIIPLSRGGQSVESNAQVLCRACNSSKGAR